MKAAAVERMSEHHIGRAIVNEANSRGIDHARQRIDEFRYIAGCGVSARVDGETVLLGSSRWLENNGVIPRPDLQVDAAGLQERAVTCVHVAVSGRELGMIGVTDQLRDDAKDLIKNLRLDGIRLTMLSGDRRKVAEAVAEQLGGMEVIAEVLPEDKDRVILGLQSQGEVVAMIGDGINDAAALTRADVGIAVGSGADVSGASADLVLISKRLDRVRQAMQLSRSTLRTVRQNIGISVVYNAVMVPLAMAALITPLIAAIAMPISSLLVVGNAIRINTVFGTKSVPAKSNKAVLSREDGPLWK
jgi:Cu2+-exporting ATPase